jgi:hypothetical protein
LGGWDKVTARAGLILLRTRAGPLLPTNRLFPQASGAGFSSWKGGTFRAWDFGRRDCGETNGQLGAIAPEPL